MRASLRTRRNGFTITSVRVVYGSNSSRYTIVISRSYKEKNYKYTFKYLIGRSWRGKVESTLFRNFIHTLSLLILSEVFVDRILFSNTAMIVYFPLEILSKKEKKSRLECSRDRWIHLEVTPYPNNICSVPKLRVHVVTKSQI